LPILHPKSTSGLKVDLHHVHRNVRFRSWIRNLYLDLKFSRTDKMQKASSALLYENYPNLVSYQKLVSTFGLQQWNKNPQHREDELQRALEAALLKDCATVWDWTLEDTLECIGCCIVGMNEFNFYCEENKIYDFLTQDYITELGKYLYKRSRKISKDKGKREITILEVGAGEGKLGASLDRELEKRGKREVDIKLVMTDLGTWRLNGVESQRVKKLDYKNAIDKFNPDIVLCAWMPLGVDWSWYFRQKESIEEYILMGEVDDGCCGDKWLTWGYIDEDSRTDLVDSDQAEVHSIDLFDWIGRKFQKRKAKEVVSNPEEQALPPYEQDHFARLELPEISKYQICRYDKEQYASNSKTVAFKRRSEVL